MTEPTVVLIDAIFCCSKFVGFGKPDQVFCDMLIFMQVGPSKTYQIVEGGPKVRLNLNRLFTSAKTEWDEKVTKDHWELSTMASFSDKQCSYCVALLVMPYLTALNKCFSLVSYKAAIDVVVLLY